MIFWFLTLVAVNQFLMILFQIAWLLIQKNISTIYHNFDDIKLKTNKYRGMLYEDHLLFQNNMRPDYEQEISITQPAT
jgi:hypothetical protein